MNVTHRFIQTWLSHLTLGLTGYFLLLGA